jgi:hypothetical protein
MFLRSWPIASYTVLAGVVLSTELVHGSPTMRSQLVAEIQGLINSLWECGTNSLVVQRGIPLLRRFINATPKDKAQAQGDMPPPGASPAAALPAAQELWPSLPVQVEGAAVDVWSMNHSEDVWSNALVALENDEASGWWTTLL